MGLTGASAEDTEGEYIRKICETDIVTGKPCKEKYIGNVLKWVDDTE